MSVEGIQRIHFDAPPSHTLTVFGVRLSGGDEIVVDDVMAEWIMASRRIPSRVVELQPGDEARVVTRD